jgi:hypothetical protein
MTTSDVLPAAGQLTHLLHDPARGARWCRGAPGRRRAAQWVQVGLANQPRPVVQARTPADGRCSMKEPRRPVGLDWG